MSAHAHITSPSRAAAEEQQLQQCHDDIEHLTHLPATWQGLDPTSIVEDVLETLVDMLDLDFAGLRFSETVHIFLRTGKTPATAHDPETIRRSVDEWLADNPQLGPSTLPLGSDVLSVVAVAMGDIAGMGVLVTGSRRAGFPQRLESLRLKIAATQASLACREVRELTDRRPPADTRVEKPTGEALAESEWRLNLIINTIPAIAWSATSDGMLDFCNQHFVDFVGLPADEILGLGFYRIFHPDDVAALLSTWQDIMASKRSREVEGRLRRADGHYRWCTLRQNPLLNSQGKVVKWYGVVLDIEDRKRAENALEEARSALLASEQNLRLIIDSLPVLAWVARPDGSAEFVNRQWAAYVGVEPEQILEWGFLDFYHPDDVEGMVDIWKDCLATKDQLGLKGRIRRFDGEYRWFYFAGQKITDANGVVRWVGANVEFEELQRAEDALKASEHRLKLIIDTIPAMAWSATADGEVDFWSKNLLDFCGLRFEDVMDEGFYRIFHPDDLEAMRSIWDRVRSSKRGEEVDARILRADGEYRWFTLRQCPLLDAHGAVVKWYGALIEIEDRKRAEEELRRSQSELARVSRVTTLGELAVSIAHEVNQPLMAIVTNAGTCLRWLDEKQFDAVRARQAAERVVRDGHRAGEIVASIRALARKEPTRMTPTDLHEAIREVLLVLNGEFRRRGIDASFQAGPEAPIVLGDRTQLQQVLLNLVMNSVEAMTEPDAVGVRMGGQLTIRSAAGPDRFARVSVQDTGTGLEQDHMDRIFEAFFSTKAGGIGMGLSICRSIVEAHGGSISASNHSPRGSTFSFTVPLAAGAAR
ncbi:PAS domain-containing sensor histidine kinase [Rhizobacter sp. P5_C2]